MKKTGLDRLDQILEIEALRRLKAAYFRFYDTKDWESWLGQLAEDATLTAEPGTIWEDNQPPLNLIGRKAIGDYLIGMAPLRNTVHHGHTHEIDLLSATEARGIWAMEDIIEYKDRRVHGHGHYYETYRKIDGQWRFATIHLKRLRLVTLALPGGELLD
ncbi:MAG: nuclear transport factor 2 family protein [Novosphingobium sp.]